MIAVHTWAALVATPLHPSADVAARGWDGGGGRDSGMIALVYSRAFDDRQRAVQHQPQSRPLQNAQTASCDRSANHEPLNLQFNCD